MGQGEAEGRDGKQVRPGRHALIAPFLTLALLFAAPAEASLSRVSAAERAIEAPSLTLAAAAPELSEFSLFEGTELAAAAAESESAPTFHPLAAVSLLDERVQRDLATPLESSYPKTRYRVFELLGTPILGVERGVSLELQWGCASLSCGFASGTVGWLSQDPLGDIDSPNLYGFVGMRPHEKTDPLGLCAFGLPCPAAAQRVIDSVADAAVQAAEATANGVVSYGKGIELGADATKAFVGDVGTMLDHSKPKAERNAAYRRVGEVVVPFVLPQLAAEMIEAAVAARAAAVGRAAAEGAVGRSVGAMARDPMSGPVDFEISPSWTPEQIAHGKAAVESANRALRSGGLSPTGRVSTKGRLRRQATREAAAERNRAEAAGQSYRGVAGHGPDTTWTGKPKPPEWQDEDWIVNSSLGAQARRYPLGYKPTEFILNDPPALVVPPAKP